MHHQALLGSTAIVVSRVDEHGARVTVLSISGATAVVVAQD
jgi:hypothetical protein